MLRWTRVFHIRPHLNDETRFYLFGKNWFLEKNLESSLILIFFKRENQIRKKTCMTPYLEKTCLQKQNLDSVVRLPIGKVRCWAITPL